MSDFKRLSEVELFFAVKSDAEGSRLSDGYQWIASFNDGYVKKHGEPKAYDIPEHEHRGVPELLKYLRIEYAIFEAESDAEFEAAEQASKAEAAAKAKADSKGKP